MFCLAVNQSIRPAEKARPHPAPELVASFPPAQLGPGARGLYAPLVWHRDSLLLATPHLKLPTPAGAQATHLSSLWESAPRCLASPEKETDRAEVTHHRSVSRAEQREDGLSCKSEGSSLGPARCSQPCRPEGPTKGD